MRLLLFSVFWFLLLIQRINASSSSKHSEISANSCHLIRPILPTLPARYVLQEDFLAACYHGKLENFEELLIKLMKNDASLVQKRIHQCLDMLLLRKDSAAMIRILVTSSHPRLLIPSYAWELPYDILDLLFPVDILHSRDTTEWLDFLGNVRAFYELHMFHYLQDRGLLDNLVNDLVEPFFSSSNCNEIPLEVTLWAMKRNQNIVPSLMHLRAIADQVCSQESLLDLVKFCPEILTDDTCSIKLIRGGSLDVYKYVISQNPTLLSEHEEGILIAILFSKNPAAVEVLDQFILDTKSNMSTIASLTVNNYLGVGPTMTSVMFKYIWQHLSSKDQKTLRKKFSAFSRNTELMPLVLELKLRRLNLPDHQIIETLQNNLAIKVVMQTFLRRNFLVPSFSEKNPLVILERHIDLLNATLPGWQELVFDGSIDDPVLSSIDSVRHLARLLQVIPRRTIKIDCSNGLKYVDFKQLESLPTPIFELFDSIYTNYAVNRPLDTYQFSDHSNAPVLIHLIGCRAKPLYDTLPLDFLKNVFFPKMIDFRHFGWIIEIFRWMHGHLESKVAGWYGSSYYTIQQLPMQKFLVFLKYLRTSVNNSQNDKVLTNGGNAKHVNENITITTLEMVLQFFLNQEKLDEVVANVEEYLTNDTSFVQIIEIVSEEVLFEYMRLHPDILQKYLCNMNK